MSSSEPAKDILTALGFWDQALQGPPEDYEHAVWTINHAISLDITKPGWIDDLEKDLTEIFGAPRDTT
jgi:hypothetical protein